MKLTKLISILGWLLIISGLTLFLFDNYNKEEPVITKEISLKEKHKICVMEMIWFEGRGLSTLEKEALLDVAINRSKSNKYPNDLCDVINQPWQYSYKNKLKDKSKIILPAFQDIFGKPDQQAYLEIQEIVNNRLDSDSISNKVLPNDTMWYHSCTIKKPYWAISKKVKEVKIPVDKKFKHRYYRAIN